MYITDIVYLLDVLVVIVLCPTAIVGIIYYCTRIGASVLKTGRGACRWGGGGVEYLTEKKFSLRNVPGVLKRKKKKKILGGGMQTKIYFSGGGGGGFWGAPRPHPGVARGRKTIHFFL